MPTTRNTNSRSVKSFSIEELGIDTSNHKPYVRFATTKDGFTQERITPLGTEAPANCLWESPAVYWLNEAERERLSKGTSSKNVQHSAIKDGRATYRVIAESDRVRKDDVEDVIQWLQDFATDYLGIDNYQLHYSGNRSIHLETDCWVNHEGWQSVKILAEAFNNETDGQLDPSIYKYLPQFRRVGVEHTKTGMCKVEISPTDSLEDIFNKSQHNTVSPHTHYTAANCDADLLLSEIEGQLIHPYIKEESLQSDDSPLYGGHHFSPYANTSDGKRSLTVMLFLELVEHQGRTYAKGYVYEAHSADDSYKRYNSFSDVLLSDRDAKKWDFSPGDDVAIIAGQSRNSRLIHIEDPDELVLVSNELRDNGRDSAFELLERYGYNIGESHARKGNYSRDGMGMSPRVREKKRKLESGETPINYPDMAKVCSSLLRVRGFSEADAWVREVCGSQYDPKDTHDMLTAIAEGLNKKPDGHPDIAIPTEVRR